MLNTLLSVLIDFLRESSDFSWIGCSWAMVMRSPNIPLPLSALMKAVGDPKIGAPAVTVRTRPKTDRNFADSTGSTQIGASGAAFGWQMSVRITWGFAVFTFTVP